MAKFYQVGGSVRDELLGLKSKDIDYAVEAESFDALRAAILDRGGKIFLETPEFFTIRAIVPSFGACDFVLCRKDGAYSDGRHPNSVAPGTIYDDLARRDFTINAIAKTEDGTILDPYGGTRDIKARILRCVGRTKDRFTEDGLRLLRALRFHVTKDFRMSEDICYFFKNADLFEDLLHGVSQERIREELFRCFQHDTYQTAFVLFDVYPEVGYGLFKNSKLWLKPTLETR